LPEDKKKKKKKKARIKEFLKSWFQLVGKHYVSSSEPSREDGG